MFLFLSKLLPLFVYPLGLAVLLIGTALLFSRYRRLHRICMILALALLVLFGNRWVALTMARSLEWRYFPQRDYPAADVIVLLGGATRAQAFPRVMTEVNEGGDRLLYAASLYHAEEASTILVSGGYIEWLGSATTEAEGMLEILGMLGVPDDAVVLESSSRNTYENAVRVRAKLEGEGVERILLVTSALHMPRARLVFQRQGFDVIPAPTDYVVTRGEPGEGHGLDFGTTLLYLLPNAEYLDLSTRVLKEYIGMVVYWMRGWL